MQNKGLKIIGTAVVAAGLLTGAFLAGGLATGGRGAESTAVATPTATVQPEDSDEEEVLLVGDGEEEAAETPEAGEADAQDADEGNAAASQAAEEPAQQQPAPPASPPVTVTPEPQPEPQAPDAEPEPFNEAPFVVSVSPEDGEVGVAIGTPLVFSFSEPMDKDSVVEAYLNGMLFCGTMNWNADATQLSIESCEGGAYGLEVDVFLAKSAKDASGLAMTDDFESQFRFVQKSEIKLWSQDAHDGYVFGPGVNVFGDKAISEGQYLTVGTWSRGFLSFDLSDLPEDLIKIESASFNVKQNSHDNGAYGPATGAMLIESVVYGSLTVDDFATPSVWGCDFCLIPILSTDAADGWKSADVAGFVRDDWEDRDDRDYRSQFRLRFAKDCGNGQCAGITAEFIAGKGNGVVRPYLVITYLHP